MRGFCQSGALRSGEDDASLFEITVDKVLRTCYDFFDKLDKKILKRCISIDKLS